MLKHPAGRILAMCATCLSMAFPRVAFGGCATDEDCGDGRACEDGACVGSQSAPPAPAAGHPAHSDPSQGSKISISLEEPVANAQVLIDGKAVGIAPGTWSVAPGEHTVAVEAPGMRRYEVKRSVGLAKTRTLKVELKRSDRIYPGVAYIGWVYDPAFGTFAIHCPDSLSPNGVYERQNPSNLIPFGGDLNLGFLIVQKKAWFELGIVYHPPQLFTTKVPEFDQLYQNVSALTLMPRLLVQIKQPKIYFTSEMEIGFSLFKILDFSDVQFHGALRIGFSFFANDWWEFRINPLGMLFVAFPPNSHGDTAYFVGYSPSIAIVLRM
jgi:hypothetical protein